MIRVALKWLLRLVMVLVLAGAVLWVAGPYEDADLAVQFDPPQFGEGVQAYFDTVESRFDDITDGVEKRVIWRPGFGEGRTPVSVLYIHGFSATSEEIRPVPDRVADALGANLVYTRLAGHGRSGDAMAEARVADWMRDTAEALAVARAVGERVVVIATSTGATLAAAAAVDPDLSQDVAAMVLISPNFGINNDQAFVLTLPAARYWLPLAFGERRSWEPGNEAKARYWTTDYPTVALLPMAALVQQVAGLDFSDAAVPALFRFSDNDKVVRHDITQRIAGSWGGPVEIQAVRLGPGDDPQSHVIAGEIESPGQTDATVADVLTWLARLGIE